MESLKFGKIGSPTGLAKYTFYYFILQSEVKRRKKSNRNEFVPTIFDKIKFFFSIFIPGTAVDGFHINKLKRQKK